MCIICVSKKGVPQPTTETIKNMFENNNHGAGYMHVKDGKVVIHKGFMELDEFLTQIEKEKFTADDVVVYHFRISTQAGVNPEMTHPFPLTEEVRYLKALDLECACGIAHNGIIQITSTRGKTDMSDTALFIKKYAHHILRTPDDLKKPEVLQILAHLIGHSKLAILDGSGYVATVGNFIKAADGLLYSNSTYKKQDDLLWWKKYETKDSGKFRYSM